MNYIDEIESIAKTGDILRTILLVHSGHEADQVFRDLASMSADELPSDTKKVLEYLITTDFDINTLDEDGLTTLMYAIINDNMDLAEFLLQNNANPDTRSAEGQSALHVAVQHESLSFVELLLDSDADINAQDLLGSTALMYAITQESEDIMAYLLERKADISIKDNEGNTAFDHCTGKGLDAWTGRLEEYSRAS